MAGMRSVASFTVNLGLFGFPVKVMKATNDPKEAIGFNLLHSPCQTQINMVRRCAKCDTNIEWNDVVKAYPHGDGFVTFTEDEIKALKPEGDGALKIEGYLPLDEMDPTYLEGPSYLLTPDRGEKKKGDMTTFAVFRAALGARYAIGQVVMYGREHKVAIRAYDKVLAMHFVRTHAEIRDVAQVPGYESIIGTAPAEYVEMMGKVMDANVMVMATVAIEKDSYVEAVENAIAYKTGEFVEEAGFTATPVAPALDLVAALKASLAATKAA